ncbi:MAG: HIT family protein [Anaerolineae bacterium]
MPDEGCYICRKHAGEIDEPGGAIYADDLMVVGHARIAEGQETAYLGYLMIETRRHVAGLADLFVDEAATLGVLAARLAQALQDTEGAEHVYAFVIGDGVPHLHLHLVPRYPGTPRDYYGPRVDEWPDAPRGGPDAIAAVCDRLREWLAGQMD